MNVKLRKSGKTEIRRLEKPGEMGIESTTEIEGELWEDIDGNVHAWTPKNSGVISIEIKDGSDNEPVQHYKKLKETKHLTTEDRIAALEEALAAALRKIAELER